MAETVYLNIGESVMAENKKVTIEDISKVVCNDPDIKFAVEKIELMNFSNGKKEQQVISSLDIIEEIQKQVHDCQIINLGSPEIIVYYRAFEGSDKLKQMLKFILICLIAFLGAGFSIISYNSDVNLVGQLDLLQNLFVGNSEAGTDIAGIAYSLGLFVGIIIFFNHGIKKKFTDDPTPLQVQMRKYEQEVNQTIVVDAERKKDIRDAD